MNAGRGTGVDASELATGGISVDEPASCRGPRRVAVPYKLSAWSGCPTPRPCASSSTRLPRSPWPPPQQQALYGDLA